MSSTTRLASVLVFVSLCAGTLGITCWKCGSYSDGVGSITPCTNRTAATIQQCASTAKYCIKYVSELTVVRDCVPDCNEKEWWGARTYCCNTDECNSGPRTKAAIVTVASTIIAIVFGH